MNKTGIAPKTREKIAIEVIKVLVTRFDNFPVNASNTRNAPFHEAFLNAFSDKLKGKVNDTPFFISLSSWLHGLNTTLGQVFFENIAHHLSNGEKMEFTSKREGNLFITQSQRNNISKILADLSNSSKLPDLEYENEIIFKDYNDEVIRAMDFSADVLIQENDKVIGVELKSVKPNSGEMKGEKQKILEGKAALYRHFPGKQIYFYIGFPFDPTIEPKKEDVTDFNKPRFLKSIINMNKYFDNRETLVASELWDFLSGHNNTMHSILEIINKIATPNFLHKFKYLKNSKNRCNKKYLDIVNEWFLFSEKKLIIHNEHIQKAIKKNNRLMRIYNKQSFDNKGNYVKDRFEELVSLINE